MDGRKVLAGYFFECLACRARFIKTLPDECVVGQNGGIYLKEHGQQATGKRKGIRRVGAIGNKRILVRCPCCLSKNVRSAEIGDKK